jgi:23S rRNA pseudouridine1911/1915/1917 synthase
MTRLRASDVAGEVVRPDAVGEDAVLTVLRVPPELAGMRVDRFVQGELKRTSRTRARFIVERSAFAADGRPLRPGDRVHAEQKVALWRPPWDEHAEEITIPILFDDGDLLAIDKPPLVPVHPTARYYRSTVVKRLEAAGHGSNLRLSHRLDRETSGVLLITRTAASDRAVKAAFERRESVEKRYLAITWGAPADLEFRVDLPLELDPVHTSRLKMRVAKSGGLESGTRFRVLETRGAERRYALVSCELETGRQHQIRVHLAAIGCPIVGDKLYGPDDRLFGRGADGELTDADRALLELDRHALHALSLGIDHPQTGARLALEAPLAPDLAAFWAGLPS